jgi:hypothetical protein
VLVAAGSACEWPLLTVGRLGVWHIRGTRRVPVDASSNISVGAASTRNHLRTGLLRAIMRNMALPDPVSPDLLAKVVAQIDVAVADLVDPHEMSVRITLTDEDKQGPLGAVAMAFDYPLGLHNGEFGAMSQWSNGYRYPPDLKDVPPDVWNWWLAAAQQVTTPLARARLNDLCFTGNHGNHENARAAAEAYLQLADASGRADESDPDPGRPLGQVVGLQRALTLARKVRDKVIAEQALAETVAAARKSLDDDDAAPGVVLGLLRILADDRTPPPDLEDLLIQARDRYRDDVWHSASVIEFQLKRVGGDSDSRAALQQDAVQVWLTEADRTDGLSRMRHLETAIKLARDYGLRSLVDEATTKLQAVRPEDLGLKPHGIQFTLPEEEVEKYLAEFTSAPSWEAALQRLLADGPPTGNTPQNRSQVEKAAAGAPLYATIPRTRIGGDGLPRFTASSDEERAEWLLAEHEVLRLRMQSGLTAEALRRVWSRWGPISEDDLTAYLGQHAHIDLVLATSLARGFLRHFSGDVEGAMYTVAPKIEALARSIALACGRPLYRTQRAKTPGQYPGLGALLPDLRKAGLDESWYRFLHTYLASVAGTNMRNELLHGFIGDVSEPASALILVAALYLAVGVVLTPQPEASA